MATTPIWMDSHVRTTRHGRSTARIPGRADRAVASPKQRCRPANTPASTTTCLAYGLGKAGELVEASGTRRTAAGRLGKTDGEDVVDQE